MFLGSQRSFWGFFHRIGRSPIPEAGWLGEERRFRTRTGEDDNHFIQMATNLSDLHGQTFVEGRRVHHTDFPMGAITKATRILSLQN